MDFPLRFISVHQFSLGVVYQCGINASIVNILSLQDAKVEEKVKRIAGVLSGIQTEIISPDSVLSSFIHLMSTLDLQVCVCSPILSL
jgi:hypothetical protein